MLLRHTELFCDVATHRSVSKAAAARGLSQPAASHAIQQLEDYFGIRLFDRSVRPMALTAAGEIYHTGCIKLLRGFQELEDQVRSASNKVCGRVRVAAIYSLELNEMSSFAQTFREDFSEVDLEVSFMRPEEVYEAVISDQVDLGIVAFPKDGGDVSCISWQRQEMVIIAPRENDWAGRSALNLAELQDRPFVALTAELASRKEIDKLLRNSGIRVKIAAQFDNFDTLRRAVIDGTGVSIVPRPTVQRDLDAGSLAAFTIDDHLFQRPLGIVHRRHNHLSTAANRFVESLTSDQGDFANANHGSEPPIVH